MQEAVQLMQNNTQPLSECTWLNGCPDPSKIDRLINLTGKIIRIHDQDNPEKIVTVLEPSEEHPSPTVDYEVRDVLQAVQVRNMPSPVTGVVYIVERNVLRAIGRITNRGVKDLAMVSKGFFRDDIIDCPSIKGYEALPEHFFRSFRG